MEDEIAKTRWENESGWIGWGTPQTNTGVNKNGHEVKLCPH